MYTTQHSKLKLQNDFYILPFYNGFVFDRFIFKFISGLKVLRGEPNSLLMSDIDAVGPNGFGYSKINDVADKFVEGFLENVSLSSGETDLRLSIKRQLKLNILEVLPKIFKMQASNDKRYVCDSEMHELLEEMEVETEKSNLMTLYYVFGVSMAEKIYKFSRKIYHSLLGNSFHDEPRFYVFKNPGKKKILWVAASSHRNKAFINQVLFLKNHYECYFLNTESFWEPNEIPGIEEIDIKNWDLPGNSRFVYSCSIGHEKPRKVDAFLKALCDKIISTNEDGIRYYASLFKKIFDNFDIDLCVVGQTDYWITSTASTISKERQITSAFFQDLFWYEGYPDPNIRTDYVVSFQRNVGFKIQLGLPKIIRNRELEKVSVGQVKIKDNDSISAKEKVLNRVKFANKNQRLVLIACHPICEPLTATRKYIIEKTLLKELAKEPINVIAKLHPQDDSAITHEVLEEIGADSIRLVKDYDFDLYLQACDLFIGTGSSSLHQAIRAKKIVAVMNYEGETLFPVAIKYGAAFSLEKEGDVHQFLKNLPSQDQVKENSRNYLEEYHQLTDSHKSFCEEVEHIIENATLKMDNYESEN